MATVYSGVGTKMAKMAGRSSAMDTVAEKVRASATASAARHRDTGQYSNNFKIATVRSKAGGVQDRLVYNDHYAALILEFGHFQENADGSLGKFIPGQFNLVKAVH